MVIGMENEIRENSDYVHFVVMFFGKACIYFTLSSIDLLNREIKWLKNRASE